jgi:hypothetical protein
VVGGEETWEETREEPLELAALLVDSHEWPEEELPLDQLD